MCGSNITSRLRLEYRTSLKKKLVKFQEMIQIMLLAISSITLQMEEKLAGKSTCKSCLQKMLRDTDSILSILRKSGLTRIIHFMQLVEWCSIVIQRITFAEVEQAAFSPSHLVPGIEASPDKMLQGRLFSYPDTHRHRLGVNYQQIPVNCPYATKGKVQNGHRDGFMTVNGNQGNSPNYSPNSFGGPIARPDARIAPFDATGVVGRYNYQHPNSDFEQPGNLYLLMTPDQKTRLVNNIVGHLGNARKEIQERQVAHFYKADPDYGLRIAKGLGLDTHKVFGDVTRSKM